MINKKGSAWMWILIILILIVVGLIVYFLFISGVNGSGVIGGNSIPQPPPLPE